MSMSTPVGGGGLIGGTALAAKAMVPGIRVVGAEPAQADDAFQSFRSGERRAVWRRRPSPTDFAAPSACATSSCCAGYVDDVVTVSEAEIVDAMRIVLADLKLLIEPSSAVAVAAVLAGKLGRPGERIGIVLSGGNIDLDLCPFLRGERL